MVKQPKIVTFEDKRFYISRYQIMPWGYFEYEYGDEFPPFKQ